jgi:crossover junction endodeoxyribonuclease RusA
VKITLPWPDPRLSPNARIHWAAKSGPKKSARYDAMIATYGALGCGLQAARASLAGNEPIPVGITFYPPDKRRRDLDNCIGSLKAAQDAVAAALEVDDSRFVTTYRMAPAEAPGRVEVCLG